MERRIRMPALIERETHSLRVRDSTKKENKQSARSKRAECRRIRNAIEEAEALSSPHKSRAPAMASLCRGPSRPA